MVCSIRSTGPAPHSAVTGGLDRNRTKTYYIPNFSNMFMCRANCFSIVGGIRAYPAQSIRPGRPDIGWGRGVAAAAPNTPRTDRWTGRARYPGFRAGNGVRKSTENSQTRECIRLRYVCWSVCIRCNCAHVGLVLICPYSWTCTQRYLNTFSHAVFVCASIAMHICTETF